MLLASGEFSSQKEKSKRSFPSIFPRIFFYHLLIKSVIQVEMEMQFRTLSYTQGQKPQPCSLSSASALHTPLPPDAASLSMARSTSGAGHQHPLCPAFTLSGRGILTGALSPSHPLHLMVFSTAPVSAPASFLPFLKNFSKEESPSTGFPSVLPFKYLWLSLVARLWSCFFLHQFCSPSSFYLVPPTSPLSVCL